MSMNRWSVVFLSGIFILPYLFFSSHFSPYEPIKVYFIIIWSILLALLSKKHVEDNFNKPLVIALLLLILECFMSSLLNGNLLQAFYGNPYRADGLIVLSAFVLISLSFSQNWNSQNTKFLIIIARINAVALPILAIIFPQMGWFFGNPVITVGYLLMLTPLAIEKITQTKWDLLWRVTSFISILTTIIYVQAWGSLLALLIMLTIKNVKALWKIAATLCTIILIITIGYLFENHNRGFTSESRQRIMTKGLIAIAKKPIFGWGWSNFSQAFKQIDYPEYYKIDAYVDRPHSSILDYGVGGGIPTLLTYLYVIYIAGKQIIISTRKDKYIWFYVLVLYVIQSQTNVTSAAEDLFFWTTIGNAIKS